MAHFAVTAVGADRPGIVAAVTKALMDLGGNLEDTEMAVLGGQFAMMMVVAAEGDGASIERALRPVGGDLDLLVAVRTIPEGEPASPPGQPWSVTVYGGDRPGIVHRVTALLAGFGVNITGLETRVIGPPGHPVYAMLLDVTVPADADGDQVAAALAQAAGQLGIECEMHLSDADVL
ncbi:MAG: glycine cleavage system transcriptional repressor [Acidimicrobiaceae bacterium]|nr:glycine cleavage system transcriptional repressor [Acidimicrobiaceae bacterium]